MIRKHFKFDIKSVDDKGSFTGYSAVFGNKDLGGDVIVKGAFAKTLAERPTHWLLWNHNADEPIGITDAQEEDQGLALKGELDLNVRRAVETHSLMQKGLAKKLPMGMSIGFDTVDSDVNAGTRYLKEIKLWENSLVPFAMNPRAQVTGVKSAEDYERMLEQLLGFKDAGTISAGKTELIDRAIKQLSALRAALSAPEAAKHEDVAPESFHATSDRIAKLLRGEI